MPRDLPAGVPAPGACHRSRDPERGPRRRAARAGRERQREDAGQHEGRQPTLHRARYRRVRGRSLTHRTTVSGRVAVGDLGPGDRPPGLAEVRAELVGAVRQHRRGLREPVLDDRIHRVERTGDRREAGVGLRNVAVPADELVEEQDDRERVAVRHDHDPLRERLGVRPLQDLEHGVGHGRHRDRRRHARIEVLRDLLRARDHGALDRTRTLVAPHRIVGGLERLELGQGRPLRVDRQPPAVGQHEPELHDLAVHAEIGRQHAGREVGEMLPQHVLARPALRRATREHGGEAPDHLALLGVGRAPLLIADTELLERAARSVEALPQLFRRQLALRGCVGHPPQLGRLDGQRGLHVGPARRSSPAGDRTAERPHRAAPAASRPIHTSALTCAPPCDALSTVPGPVHRSTVATRSDTLGPDADDRDRRGPLGPHDAGRRRRLRPDRAVALATPRPRVVGPR